MGGIRQIMGHPWVRKLKPADIKDKTIPTPIKIDLLTFNINEQQIEEGGEQAHSCLVDEAQPYVADEEFSSCSRKQNRSETQPLQTHQGYRKGVLY